ncbi:hypothetical protein BGAL_0157g00140 [Botrytis galanthina]|uniref:Uncharacterized protein n=1 Tax=Botrytis galanthina TaxID=278940 RepID=A0A4S8QY40_9HELO|nr:hypothetical protein BGAL_0157g00140 [Botrytis galanthina]
MSSPPRKLTPKVLGPFEAGKQACREDRVETLFKSQYPEEYHKGYEAGLKAEKNLGIPGTEEWKADRIAKEAKEANELEVFNGIAERKAKEARRIKEAIEIAYRDAVIFHREFDNRKEHRKRN